MQGQPHAGKWRMARTPRVRRGQQPGGSCGSSSQENSSVWENHQHSAPPGPELGPGAVPRAAWEFPEPGNGRRCWGVSAGAASEGFQQESSGEGRGIPQPVWHRPSAGSCPCWGSLARRRLWPPSRTQPGPESHGDPRPSPPGFWGSLTARFLNLSYSNMDIGLIPISNCDGQRLSNSLKLDSVCLLRCRAACRIAFKYTRSIHR